MNSTITKNRQKPKWLLLLLFILVIQVHAHAQGITVTGTIVDENGQALPGVNVQVSGTTIGVSSDAKGKYTINVPNTNELMSYSFVGYVTQEIQLKGRTI